MKKNRYDVVVIGGGAAALYLCALLKGRSVAVLEASDRVGKKLLATGNGKCNLTNVNCSASAYNDSRVSDYLAAYGPAETMHDFEAMGLALRRIEDRVYPYSECASTVSDVLRSAAQRNGVDIRCLHVAENIIRHGKTFTVQGTATADGKKTSFGMDCDCVVVACGSAASAGRDSLGLFRGTGHTVRPFVPSLAPLRTDRESVKGLSGVRVKCSLSLGERKESGEVLFKDNGISGIATFNISAEFARGRAEKGDTVLVDFMPDRTEEEIVRFIAATGGNAVSALRGMFHSRVAERIATRAQRDFAGNADALNLAKTIKNYPITVTGLSDASQAQVMSGGLSLGEFDGHLCSLLCDGLFAAGETLDVDGLCGGYNLQWAWTSAHAVAEGIAERFS